MRRVLVGVALTVGTLGAPAIAQAGLIPPAGPWPIEVSGLANPLAGTALPTNGTNATANVDINAWVPRHGHHESDVTRLAGQSSVVRGQLTNRDTHKRIGGASVTIVAENPYAPGWFAVQSVFTTLTGRFRAVLPPPSGHRRYAVVYYPDTVQLPLASRRLLVRAKSRATLDVYRHGGRSYRFRGQISAGAAAIPPGGLLIALKARNSQGVWLTVRLGHTQPDGRYQLRYRFPSRATLRVRVVVPAQSGWPFYAGKSRMRTVHPG